MILFFYIVQIVIFFNKSDCFNFQFVYSASQHKVIHCYKAGCHHVAVTFNAK